MSTDVEPSPASDGPGIAIQQDSPELSVERDSGKAHSPTAPYNVSDTNASDSGVSNASSLTSDCTVPLNNGDIHELTKSVLVEEPKAANTDVGGGGPSLPQRSMSSPNTESSTLASINTDHPSSSALLGVSETEHGLSMLSLAVMTSGEQLNLIAEGLGESEGSVGSRSLSPADLDEEKCKEEEVGSGDDGAHGSKCGR